MASDKVVETVIAGNYVEMETEGKPKDVKSQLSSFLWHGGSAYDAWFSCASNQVGGWFFKNIFLSILAYSLISFVLFQHHELPCSYVVNVVLLRIMFTLSPQHVRLLKCCLRCHTHFPSWECSLAYFFNSYTVYLVAGRLTSLAYSTLNTEQEKREKKLTSETMSSRFNSPTLTQLILIQVQSTFS